MDKPNIIFLMTDQQRWDCIGKYNDVIKTPNIDRLSESGITFSDAVCQYPACVPSRNAMMYGLYPSQLGVRSNSGGLFYEDRISTKALPQMLKDAGYLTAGFGKTHWQHGVINKKPSTRGFDIRVIGQDAGSELYEHGAYMMSKGNPEGLKAYFEETKNYGDGEENTNGYIGETSKLKNRDHRDGWVAEQCLEFLDTYKPDSDEPLFLYLSFLKPHAGFNVPKEFEDLYDINDIEDVKQPPWDIDDEPDNHLCNREEYKQWRETWKGLSAIQRRRTTLRYYANISWLDSYFGEVLDRLEELGVLDNSLIVFTSDHGDLMSERHYMFRKYNLYDSSVRVPLVLSGSCIPKDKTGTVDNRPAEHIDLYPTIASIANGHVDPRLPGINLLKETRRKGSFSEFHGLTKEGFQASPAYMWRNEEFKLILYLDGALKDNFLNVDDVKGELYNLKEDPNEWENLYEEDSCRDIRESMKTELLMHLACTYARGPMYYDAKDYYRLGC